MTEQRKSRWRVLALVWTSTAFIAWPVLRHRPILVHSELRTHGATYASYVVAALILYGFYRSESRRLDRSRNVILIILISVLTCFVNQIHHHFVDQSSEWAPNNLVWQEQLQIKVAKLAPDVLPHSYRFLPNGIVLWMQICRINFDAARDIYRLLVGLLLFYAIYRYARLYTDYLGAVLTMLLIALAYPISFENYAGQLTDPLSHLSFVLAFIFLESGDFAFLFSTILIGSLAKETVLAVSGFYVLFCRSDRRYVPKALALSIASLVLYCGVRLLVLNGPMHYQHVSGVTPDHISANLRSFRWPIPFLILGGYAAFLILGWRETPSSLKRLGLYLTLVLVGSNVFFGWVGEARNYMPAVFVLSVIAARYISRRCSAQESSAPAAIVQTSRHAFGSGRG